MFRNPIRGWGRWTTTQAEFAKLVCHDSDRAILTLRKVDPHRHWEAIVSACFDSAAISDWGFGNPEVAQPLLLLYERIPGGICHKVTVKLLDKLDRLPAWIIERMPFRCQCECPHNSHPSADGPQRLPADVTKIRQPFPSKLRDPVPDDLGLTAIPTGGIGAQMEIEYD